MKVSLTFIRALKWNYEVTPGPPSCLTNWGHGGKFFLQRVTLERTLQPILCTTHPVDRCGDSQTLHLLDEASGRKAGMENCPLHIRLLWVEARAAATTTTFHQHLHFLLLKDSRGRKAKAVKGTTQQKQTKKLWGFLRAQVILLTEQPGSSAAYSGIAHPPCSTTALLSYTAGFCFPSVPSMFSFSFFSKQPRFWRNNS